MPAQPKRPNLPAPDPNWELDLHPERAAGSKKPSPDSRDELLAHALLRAEPDPFDRPAAAPPKPEPDSRRTLPPPGAMSEHVARMMAEAAMLDDGFPAVEEERETLEVFMPETFADLDSVRSGREAARAAVAPPPLDDEPDLRLVRSSRSPSLSDLSDLPAVFSLDSWTIEEPASAPPRGLLPGLAPADPLDDEGPPVSSPFPRIDDPGISRPPPASEPAISSPFASLDAMELVAELELSHPPARPAPTPAALRPQAAPVKQPVAAAPDDKLAAIEARLAAGDYGRALVLAESALDVSPGDLAILAHAERCRQMLYERYLDRLGASESVPRLLMQRGALTGLALDHRAGFLLSCVDGYSTVEELIDVSAMPRLDAVRILYELVQEGVIEMVAPRG